MFRRYATAALAAAALLALPGCLDAKETVHIKKDGSGSATVSMNGKTAMLEQLKQLAMMVPAMTGGGGASTPGQMPEGMDMIDLSADTFRKRIKKIGETEGVTVTSSAMLDDKEAGTQGARYAVAFDSLRALIASDALLGTSMSLVKNEDGSYTMRLDRAPKQLDQMPAMDDPRMAQQMEMFGPMLAPFGEGFSMKLEIKLPTEIIAAEGGTVRESDGAVIWNLAFDSLLKSPKKALRRSVTFSGEGLDWAPFTARSGVMAQSEAAAGPVVTPSTPSTPETPDTPEVPGVPEAPEVPEAPATPEPVK